MSLLAAQRAGPRAAPRGVDAWPEASARRARCTASFALSAEPRQKFRSCPRMIARCIAVPATIKCACAARSFAGEVRRHNEQAREASWPVSPFSGMILLFRYHASYREREEILKNLLSTIVDFLPLSLPGWKGASLASSAAGEMTSGRRSERSGRWLVWGLDS